MIFASKFGTLSCISFIFPSLFPRRWIKNRYPRVGQDSMRVPAEAAKCVSVGDLKTGPRSLPCSPRVGVLHPPLDNAPV